MGRSSRTGKRHDMIPKEDDIGLNERAVAFSARDVQKVYTFSFEQVIPILLAPLPKNEEKQMTNGRYILWRCKREKREDTKLVLAFYFSSLSLSFLQYFQV